MEKRVDGVLCTELPAEPRMMLNGDWEFSHLVGEAIKKLNANNNNNNNKNMMKAIKNKVRAKNEVTLGGLADEIYSKMNNGDHNTTFCCVVGEGKVATPFRDRLRAVGYIKKRIHTDVLSEDVRDDCFVFPHGLKPRNDAIFEEAVQTAISYYEKFKGSPIDPLEFEGKGVLGDQGQNPPTTLDWERENTPANKAVYLADRIIRPKFERLLQFEIHHYRPMGLKNFMKICVGRIMETELKKKEEKLRQFAEHAKDHFEIGTVSLLFLYRSKRLTNQWFLQLLLFLFIVVQISIPVTIGVSSNRILRDSGKQLCDEWSVGDAKGLDKAAGAFIGLLYIVLACFRFWSHGDGPSPVFVRCSSYARRCMTADRIWFLICKEIIHVVYLFALSSDADAKALIINSGALEFWLNADVVVKRLVMLALPPDFAAMFKVMSPEKNLSPENAPIERFRPNPTCMMIFGLIRVLILAALVISVVGFVICKPDFSATF